MSSSERAPLLAGGHDPDHAPEDRKPSRFGRVGELALFAWALLATAAVIVIAVWAQHRQQTASEPHKAPAAKRNLVFMVSDGMGPAPLSMTRSFRQYIEGLPENDTLTLDKHLWGSSRTRSSSQLVTDSAAGATAFSCGFKSYNGAISVLPNYKPCGSVMEAAKRAGYTTGLVATTSLTDATPATFASHAVLRSLEDSIALQEIGEGVLGRNVDLMLGGGRCHFLPNTNNGSCRGDDVDVVEIAKEKHGWTVTDDRAGFDALQGGENAPLPYLGLYAHYDIPFELDRRNQNDVYPSLSEMAKTALRALEKATEHSDKGFFVMIEGSRIDHAGHQNDPAAQVHEVIEYDRTFQAVLDFIAQSETETVLVGTSDHETGGLALGRQLPGSGPVYNWYPKVLSKATASSEYLSKKLGSHMDSLAAGDDDKRDKKEQKKKKLKEWINEKLVVAGLGISDASDDELTSLADAPDAAQNQLCDMISRRANIGWSTHGHTGVDVNIYSSGGPLTERLRGNVENTEVGRYLRDFLGVDVEPITKELQEKTPPPGTEVLAAVDRLAANIDQYDHMANVI